jgi:hypothetical protein
VADLSTQPKHQPIRHQLRGTSITFGPGFIFIVGTLMLLSSVLFDISMPVALLSLGFAAWVVTSPKVQAPPNEGGDDDAQV